MRQDVEQRLRSLFGEDVNFDRVERKLYSHDVGSIPRLLQPLLPGGVAGAVVQPRDEAALLALLTLADEAGFEVVPRGAATAGYGGAVPRKDAVVVDMRGFKRILRIDRAGLQATVQAGVVWRDLEAVLAEHELCLRLYPTSAPSSTVGGWLAQGGSGHGSYRYGWFKENVVSARVVLPGGEVREFDGEGLALIGDAEGTTGIITEVTLAVERADEVELVAAAFARSEDLQEALTQIGAEEIPLWSVGFVNPEAVRLGKRLPAKTHHGHPIHPLHTPPEVPEQYVALFAWRSRSLESSDALLAIVNEAGGTILPQDVAEHEWELRFSPMRTKRLGPSLIPTEVVVPSSAIGAVLDELQAAVELPMVIEGLGVHRDEVVLLGFIPHDERSFGYNVAFGLALSAIKIARNHGGRPYSTGVYFQNAAEDILGSERLSHLRRFKSQIDPRGLMNPGKVMDGGVLNSAMRLAESVEPIIRSLANGFSTELGERLEGGSRGIPDDVARYAYACAQCGYCVEGCTQFMGRGWESHSPRGKWYFLRLVLEGKEEISQEWVEKFLVCTTCERCETVCPLDLPIEAAWAKLRGVLIQEQGRMTFPPFEMMAASLQKEGNIWAGYRADRTGWLNDEIEAGLTPGSKTAYFAGCTASYIEQDIAQGSALLLEKAGVEFTYLGNEENCCGIPMLISGRWDVWEENLRRNIANMHAAGVETIITSCPACYLVWKTYYPAWAEKLGIPYDLEAKHYSEVLADEIREGRLRLPHSVDLTVTFHDSCHAGRACGLYDPPRELLRAIPGLEVREMAHNREDGYCCGSVLTLIGATPVAADLGEIRLQEALDIGVHDLVALCPCCQFQLRVSADKKGVDVTVHDLAHLAAQGLGVELPQYHEACLSSWRVFDQMIVLMKPENMAGLMEQLFPQMMAAMPLGMGSMMRRAAKVPGALRLMERLMPKLFPLLMPMIMPKVMPDMVAAVDRYMDVPDDMREQLPDLLPKTMENLMPNMLPLLMPYVVPRMMECLKSGPCAQASVEAG
jgi:Fe-S oxidoreductase/FAD/FMN-containing dehydrogenase